MKAWKRWLFLGMAAGAAMAVAVARASSGAGSRAGTPRGATVREEAEALTPRVTPEMVRYSYTRYALYFVDVALDLAILVLFLRTGASARWRDRVEKRIGRPVMQTLVYFLGFSIAYSALTLPLTFYSGWWLPHQVPFSDQPLPAWAWDRIKEAVIGFAITAPLVLALYAFIRRQPRRWWFSFWLLSIPVTILMVLVAPVVLDPVFHKYEPLRNQKLRDQILALAAKAGIQGGRVYEVGHEPGDEDGQRLRHWAGGYEADRAVGHDAAAAETGRDPVHHGPRDGPLCLRPRLLGRGTLDRRLVGPLLPAGSRGAPPAGALGRRYRRRRVRACAAWETWPRCRR